MMGAVPLFIFLICFWIVRTISETAKKATTNQKKAPAAKASVKAVPQAPSEPGMEAHLRQEFPHLYQQEAESSPLSPERDVEAQAYGSLPPTAPEGTDPCHDDPYTMASGSLGAESLEGLDPDHDHGGTLFTEAEDLLMPSTEPAGLRLGWTGDEMVRGFIYGEILKRKVG